MLGKHGVELLCYRDHLGRRVGFVKICEYGHDFFENFARAVKRENGVLKSGSVRVGNNRIDLFLMLSDSGLERRQVVVIGDLIERGDLVGSGVRFQERILVGVVAACD